MITDVKPIFNPQGDDSIQSRSMWGGNITNLMQLNSIRFPWALAYYNQFRENFWIPQKLDITGDRVSYLNLNEPERRAFDGILSYLTFLDSVQVTNVPHLAGPITAPEVTAVLSEQVSQETMHSASYQYIVETVIPQEKRNSVYELWRNDSLLRERCQYIANLYQRFLDTRDQEDYFYALIGDYMLEGCYFYQGFMFFYTLASRGNMTGCADVFKLINRDEISHVKLYQNIIREAMKTMVYSEERIYTLFDTAANFEIDWNNHIIGDSVLGINATSIENYTKYLVNLRLSAIGLKPLYEGSRFQKNPYAHLDRFASVSSDGSNKTNFFEGTVTEYNMRSAISGWDSI